MPSPREITRDDLMDMEAYAAVRKERRERIQALKKDRRVEVGPYATFYFENYDTMLHQVHEMLYAERGGEAQIPDELAAYNPLIPNGRELVATFMIEIGDPARRDRELRRLTFIERTITMTVEGEEIRAVAETDVERTRADGKTSSIHFVRFPLTDTQATNFRKPGANILLGIAHENYSHMAKVPESVREALAQDLA